MGTSAKRPTRPQADLWLTIEAEPAVLYSLALQADTAQRELKKLQEETGMFGSISDEEINNNVGKTYQDLTALRDPLMGLGYDEPTDAEPRPFDGAAQDAAVTDYNPNQPRDKNGRWTGGGGSGKIGKTKYAPSPQKNREGIQLKPKTYARLTGILNTRYPGLKAGEVRTIRSASRQYTVEADGYGGFKTLWIASIK